MALIPPAELGMYADELLRSAERRSLPETEIARANDALALWVPELRVVLINKSHSAFVGLDDPTLARIYARGRRRDLRDPHGLAATRKDRKTSMAPSGGL